MGDLNRGRATGAQRWLSIGLLALLPGCVYLPRTVQTFDANCGIVANHAVLEPVQVGAIQHCANEGCVVLIAAASAVTAASVVISGTIVIVDNVGFWLERRSHCDGARPAVDPAR